MYGIIEGYASVFDEVDLYNDLVKFGAFTKKLIPATIPDVKMLYQHKVEEPIGKWEIIEQDAYGLYVRGKLNLEFEPAARIWQLINDSVLNGLSIGFKVVESYQDQQIRVLTELDLWEISIVTFPMLSSASIRNYYLEEKPEMENLLVEDMSNIINQTTEIIHQIA